MANGSGEAILDFSTGANYASVVVTGQSGITTSAQVEAWVYPEDTTGLGSGHTEDEHAMVVRILQVWVAKSSITSNTGFVIQGQCLSGLLTGKWNIGWAWNG